MVKKYSYLFVLALVLVLGLNVSFAADNQLGPNIQVVKNEVVPEPVEPGNDFTLKISITNSGDVLANDINVIPEVTSPFYYKNSDFTRKNFALCGGCSYDATYYLSVDPNTVSGIYPINFKITYGNGIVKDETVLVKVVGVPDLTLSYDKTKLYFPGDDVDLKLNISNIGTGNARNIKVTSLSDKIVLTGVQTKVLDNLTADSSKVIHLNYVIDSNLGSGIYNVPLKISYIDEQGNKYDQDYTLSFNIGDNASIDLESLKIENYESKLFDTININGIVENYGDGKAENVYAYLETDLEGYKKSFVGTLEAGEDSPISFKLKASKTGTFPVKLYVVYNDDKGQHKVEENFEVKVVKPTDKLYTILGIIGVIFLLIVGKVILSKKRK